MNKFLIFLPLILLMSNKCSEGTDSSKNTSTPHHQTNSDGLNLTDIEKSELKKNISSTLKDIFYKDGIIDQSSLQDLNYIREGEPAYNKDNLDNNVIEKVKKIVQKGDLVTVTKDGEHKIVHYSNGDIHLIVGLDSQNRALGYLKFSVSGDEMKKNVNSCQEAKNLGEKILRSNLKFNSSDVIYIDILIVNNNKRKMGIATSLFNNLESYAKKIGKKHFLLYTWDKGRNFPENKEKEDKETPAHKFYKKMKFDHYKECEATDGVNHTVYMVKSL